MNVNKFKTVAFEFTTIETPIDISGSNIQYICDLNGNAIGFLHPVVLLEQQPDRVPGFNLAFRWVH